MKVVESYWWWARHYEVYQRTGLPSGYATELWEERYDYGLYRPALALAAFVAWKVAWLVIERRRRRSAT